MIIAALWIVFLIGFVAGCAWANAVRTPAPIMPDDERRAQLKNLARDWPELERSLWLSVIDHTSSIAARN